MKELKEATTGDFVGVGVHMGKSTELNAVVIIDTIEGAPANRAGIKSGDIISRIDDTDCIGKSTSEVTKMLAGDSGTSVNITIIRDSEELEFNIIREKIKEKTISSKMLDNSVAYIGISSFDIGTADEFKEHYNNIKGQNPRALILDLRNNGGGVVEEALKIADMMVEKGKTLLISIDKSKKEKEDKSKSSPIVDIPVVILINGRTASSAEILTASLKDNCGYKIVGKNSYGKGVIQAIVQFTDGTGLKVTTNEYFSPNHNTINNRGIKPDIDVDLDDEWKSYLNVPYESDKQLQAAMNELR